MKKISPVTIWSNGETKQANYYNMYVVNDDLSSTATFYYQLLEVITETKETETTDEDGNVTVTTEEVTVSNKTLSQGNLTISGQEYIDWNQDPDINQAAYEWAAQKLGITLEN